MSCLEQRLVDGHFAGTIAETEERSLRAHVTTCRSCRDRYRRRLLLAQLDPEALSAEERLARGLGFQQPRPVSKRARLAWLSPVAAALALAAILLLFLRPHPSEPTPRGIVATTTPEPLTIYKLEADAGPTLAVDQIKRDDELAFAYRNVDDRAFLMIFAVGDGGRVYWFYPAWSNETEHPTAVPIARDRASHPLAEAIRHRPTGERLEVHALFLDRALTVQEVERALEARGKNSRGPLGISEGADHITSLGVRP